MENNWEMVIADDEVIDCWKHDVLPSLEIMVIYKQNVNNDIIYKWFDLKVYMEYLKPSMVVV